MVRVVVIKATNDIQQILDPLVRAFVIAAANLKEHSLWLSPNSINSSPVPSPNNQGNVAMQNKTIFHYGYSGGRWEGRIRYLPKHCLIGSVQPGAFSRGVTREKRPIG